jgi:hypothetical protein
MIASALLELRAIVDVVPYLPSCDGIELFHLEEGPFPPARDALWIGVIDLHADDSRHEGPDCLGTMIVFGAVGETL